MVVSSVWISHTVNGAVLWLSAVYEYHILLVNAVLVVSSEWMSHTVNGAVLWLSAVNECHTLLLGLCCDCQQCMNITHSVDGSVLSFNSVWISHTLLVGPYCGCQQCRNITHSVRGSVLWLSAVCECHTLSQWGCTVAFSNVGISHTLLVGLYCGFQQCRNITHPVSGSVLPISSVRISHC